MQYMTRHYMHNVNSLAADAMQNAARATAVCASIANYMRPVYCIFINTSTPPLHFINFITSPSAICWRWKGASSLVSQ